MLHENRGRGEVSIPEGNSSRIRRGKRRSRGGGITDWRGEVVDEHVCDEGQGGERERGEGEEDEEEEQAVLVEEKEGALHKEFRGS